MNPFDKIVSGGFNALNINCTHYTKTIKPQQQQNQGEQNHLGTNLI